jgi:hypothetical protein
MSSKEVPRVGLLKAAVAGRITNAQGAWALRLSVRQFRRLKRRLREQGARGLVHALRGRPSNRRLEPPPAREQIGVLLITTYAGFNDVHLTEKLREVHHLVVSRSSVRHLRLALGRPATRRRTAPAASQSAPPQTRARPTTRGGCPRRVRSCHHPPPCCHREPLQPRRAAARMGPNYLRTQNPWASMPRATLNLLRVLCPLEVSAICGSCRANRGRSRHDPQPRRNLPRQACPSTASGHKRSAPPPRFSESRRSPTAPFHDRAGCTFRRPYRPLFRD